MCSYTLLEGKQSGLQQLESITRIGLFNQRTIEALGIIAVIRHHAIGYKN